MIRMRYPDAADKLKEFHKNYTETLLKAIGEHEQVIRDLKKVLMADGSELTLEKLLLAPFDELSSLNADIAALSIAAQKRLRLKINYKKRQVDIAGFFMREMAAQLQSCFYCNIDSIYAFRDIDEYQDSLDFVSHADKGELLLIKNIGPATAQKIMDYRASKAIASLTELKLRKEVLQALKDFQKGHTHNHFTLDHFYHQEAHPFVCLSLYNFVPCCYACNSKFKKTSKVYSSSAGISSPSSAGYSFAADTKFKLFFNVADHDVRTTADFMVKLVAVNNTSAHKEFIKILKLSGRYYQHKKEALKLMMLKQKYPAAAIAELSAATGLPADQIKKDLFGADLYDNDFDNVALVKYRRDIARDIFLPDVRLD